MGDARSLNGFTLGVVSLSLAFGLMPMGAVAQSCQNPTPVWADEFDGTALDTTKWFPMTGDGCDYGICGWGNNELQFYKAENATVSGGYLTITAKKQRVRSKAYTSARLRTANMPNGGEWTNGRFEASIKLPNGTGMWPAFWMLPTDPDVGWPTSGEIDILESTGQGDMFALGTIHVGDPWEFTGNRVLKQPDSWSADFHEYAIEWDPNEIRWYVDDLLYSVKTPSDLSDPALWKFENYQYHLLLNLAVGGNIGGTVDDSMLPQVMQVDYVRVYDYGQPSITGEHLVEPNSSATYSVIDEAGTGSSYSWTVPAGATITSGANSSTVTVDWGTAGGELNVLVNNSCGSSTLALDVYVAPQLLPEFTHDDFEGNRNLAYTTWTGTFDQAASNPAADAVNSSATVARYTRDSTEQYDVIAGTTTAIPDALGYLTGDKAFYMDVYTAAPAGTMILVQLENNASATATNYPTGRHSKYIAHTTVQNGWERLKFKLEDRIDGGTGHGDVDSIIILIDPDSAGGDTYYWDNFQSYGAGTGNVPPTASFTFNCNGLTCDFNASSSSDSDGSIVDYSWDFGDSNGGAGVTASHSYATSGNYTVTLTVTDNGGATDSSSDTVSVTGGTATDMSVTSVVTGTQGAGKGQKRGKATVTVSDNNGNPVANATVTGNFSGDINETGVTGLTGADGTVELLTTATAGGKVNVDFCVSSLSHASLNHDVNNSVGLCQ